MKRILFVIFSVLLVISCTVDNKGNVESNSGDEGVTETAVRVGGEVGDNAPDFNVLSLEGKQVSYYNDFKGKKPVYLIFWATW